MLKRLSILVRLNIAPRDETVSKKLITNYDLYFMVSFVNIFNEFHPSSLVTGP